MDTIKRIKNIQAKLSAWDVDALYCVNTLDILYLTGFDLSKGVLFITSNDIALMVDNRYFEACKRSGKIPTYPTQTLTKLFQNTSFKKIERVGFDAQDLSFASFESLKNDIARCDLIPLETPVKWIRSIKDHHEIEKIRAACKLCNLGFEYLLTLIKREVTEKFLAKELEIFWLRQGADKLAFQPIIAFGKNSAYPHYRAGDEKLLPNQSILIDIGVVLENYHSDMTRIVYFGRPDNRIIEMYETVLFIQQSALSSLKDGVACKDLDLLTKKIVSERGFGKEMMHSLGHGVGLEIHELPLIKKEPSIILKEGMVVTIEPGIYLPEVGGIRIEDMVLIQKEGFQFLTEHVSKPVIIEQ